MNSAAESENTHFHIKYHRWILVEMADMFDKELPGYNSDKTRVAVQNAVSRIRDAVKYLDEVKTCKGNIP